MRSWLAITFALTLGGICFGLGRLSAPGTANPSRGQDPKELHAEMAELRGSVDDLRRLMGLVVGEVASFAGRSGPANGGCPSLDAQASAKEAVPTEEAVRARERDDPHFREAERMIATSITRGTWTGQEVEQFRKLAPEAPHFDWIGLMPKSHPPITPPQPPPHP